MILAFISTVALGVALGILIYVFVYARGYSYLTDNPASCMNCHVMREQYEGWLGSSHHGVAVCNDCHTPPGLISKYSTKALNGFLHTLAFTSGNFHEPIRIGGRNAGVTDASCIKCHAQITHAIRSQGDNRCAHCHRSVGHLH